jgi:ATP-dependent helicase HrpA
MARLGANDVVEFELELYRWMLEEFRVSLFAQQLGVSMPVSAVRLDKQWAKVTP